MKKLLFSAALGLLALATTGPRASAWGLFNWCCCHDCCATICCKQYNAFTPCCFGTICCNGCCPIAYGNCGPNAPGALGCGQGWGGNCGWGGCGYGGCGVDGCGAGGCGYGGCGGADGYYGGDGYISQLPAPPATPYSAGSKLPVTAPPASGSSAPTFTPPMPSPSPTPGSSGPSSMAWPTAPATQAGYYPLIYGAMNPQGPGR